MEDDSIKAMRTSLSIWANRELLWEKVRATVKSGWLRETKCKMHAEIDASEVRKEVSNGSTRKAEMKINK